uniref:Serine/threonine-protein phosphatase 2A 56 kDa regulatory subunit gamma isoform (Trinotate prediction) n=1 Tax=Myxobolus squamalis TaxID=59785 RepID=A0A6B2FW22_MYXSQ
MEIDNPHESSSSNSGSSVSLYELEETSDLYSTETYPEDDIEPNKLKLSQVPHGTKIQGSSFLKGKYRKNIQLLPSLAQVPSAENEKLLIQKIRLCCTMFDFNDPTDDIRGKEVKRTTLKELSDFENICTYNYLTKPVYKEFFRMFEENLFRAFPFASEFDIDLEDEEEYYECSWPHISLVYEILYSIIISNNFNIELASPLLNEGFLCQVFETIINWRLLNY